jgi:hypothetical protein
MLAAGLNRVVEVNGMLYFLAYDGDVFSMVTDLTSFRGKVQLSELPITTVVCFSNETC